MRLKISSLGKTYDVNVDGDSPLSTNDLDDIADGLGIPKNAHVQADKWDSKPTPTLPTYDPNSIKFAGEGGGIGGIAGAVTKVAAQPNTQVGPSQVPAGNLPESDFTRRLAQSGQLQHAQSLQGYNEANTPAQQPILQQLAQGPLQSAANAGRDVAQKQAKRQQIIDAAKHAEELDRLQAGTAAANPAFVGSNEESTQYAPDYGKIGVSNPNIGRNASWEKGWKMITKGLHDTIGGAVASASPVMNQQMADMTDADKKKYMETVGSGVSNSSVIGIAEGIAKPLADSVHTGTVKPLGDAINGFLDSVNIFDPTSNDSELFKKFVFAGALALGAAEGVHNIKSLLHPETILRDYKGLSMPDVVGRMQDAARNPNTTIAQGLKAVGVDPAAYADMPLQIQRHIDANKGRSALPENAPRTFGESLDAQSKAQEVIAKYKHQEQIAAGDRFAEGKLQAVNDRLNPIHTIGMKEITPNAVPPSFDAFVSEHGKVLLQSDLNAIESLRARGNLPSSDPDFAGLTKEDVFHLAQAKKAILEHMAGDTLPDDLKQHLAEIQPELASMYKRIHGVDPLIYDASSAAAPTEPPVQVSKPTRTQTRKQQLPPTEEAIQSTPTPIPAPEPVAPINSGGGDIKESNTAPIESKTNLRTAPIESKTNLRTEGEPHLVGVNNRTMAQMDARGEVTHPEPNKLGSIEDRNKASSSTTIDDAIATAKLLKAQREAPDHIHTAKATSDMLAGLADAQMRMKKIGDDIAHAIKENDISEVIKLKAERDRLDIQSQELIDTAKSVSHKEFAGIGHSLQGARDIANKDMLTNWARLGPELKLDFASKNGAEMPPALEEEFKSAIEKIKTHEETVSRLERELAEERAKAQIESTKKTVEKESRVRRIARDSGTIAQERKDILGRLKEAGGLFETKSSGPRGRSGGSAEIPINIEAARAIKDLAKNLIESGVGTLEDVINHIVKLAPDLSKGDVMRALAHTEPKPTLSEVQKQIQKVRREAKSHVDVELQIQKLRDQYANGPWEETVKRQNTPVSKALEQERFMRDVEKNKLRSKIDSLKKRSPVQKLADAYRVGVLTSPTSIIRLNLAALSRIVGTPIEEGIGAGIRRLPGFKDIAAKSAHEGYSGLSAEKDALKQRTSGSAYKEMYNVIRHGYNTVSAEFGATQKEGMGTIPGRTHEAVKTPTFMADYARRLNQSMQHAEVNGIDVSHPAINWGIRKEAHDYALRSKSAQDNAISSVKQRIIKSKPWTEPIFTLLAPVEKVATNLAIERAETSPAGLAVGLYRSAMHLYKGVDSLTPREADITMRLLKKGAKGTALFYLGYKGATSIIGAQQQSKQEYFDRLNQLNDAIGGGEDKERKLGDTKIGGTVFPHWLMDHVADAAMVQYGGYIGTLERLGKSPDYKPEDGKTPNNLPSVGQGMANVAINAAKTSPAIDLPFTAADLLTSDYARAQKVGGAIPGGVKWMARLIDELHNPTNRVWYEQLMNPGPKRVANSVNEKLQESIPIYREKLPLKQ